MKFKKQNQHGVLAIVFMPLILCSAAGVFHPSQILYGIGWLLMFFAADHVLIFIKRMKRKKDYGYLKAAGLIGGTAVVLLIYPLFIEYRIIYFCLGMLPLGAITSYFSMIKDERSVIEEICAIMIFSIAG